MPYMRSVRTSRRKMPMTVTAKPTAAAISIRSVWADNLEQEFALIRAAVIRYPFAVIDTEFPGTIHTSSRHHLSLTPEERYSFLKANVDDLSLIQVGITLTDAAGHLPDLGTRGASRFVWEFNFREFDECHDPHNPLSIALLKQHGVDFEKNRSRGVDSCRFARLLFTSGLICNASRVSWVAFSGAYDFAYLIKTLTRRKLPETMNGFLRLLAYFFGLKVFDMKHLMKFCSLKLNGGLEKVAGELKVVRVAGNCHQAGSDSLLTSQAFQKMSRMIALDEGWERRHNGVLCGLQVC